MKTNYEFCIYDEEYTEYTTELEINFEWSNSGIGHYEYWGAKGFDRGHDYVEDYSVKVLKTDAPQHILDHYLASEEAYEKIIAYLEDQHPPT